MPQRTPLAEWHENNRGRMVDFAGWSMPVQYSSIVSEHLGTRKGAGVFDVSHMGRVAIEGSQATEWLESRLTRQVRDLPVGRARYTLITGVDGTGGKVQLDGTPVILDDALVTRLADQKDTGQRFILVVNASNRQRVVCWLEACLPPEGVTISDITEESAMIAVQGPRVFGHKKDDVHEGPLRHVFEERILEQLAALPNYGALETQLGGEPVLVSRTGYTGEDGVEIILKSSQAQGVWEELVEKGGAIPCGLGSRDTLRLEAAMPLYGHELHEQTDPFSAGLGFAVNIDGREFPGAEEIRTRRGASDRRRIGLVFESRRAARSGDQVMFSKNGTDSVCGEITSGSFSPTCERGIALAVVDRVVLEQESELEVLVRGVRLPAKLVSLPFYRRPRHD
ncbi:MAG: glycine cleavage system aminomethyltransferase GcvT [Pirellulales bacterium]|nr:glycine cleavage system aminomethyltransferase GcvT [Pirellulales bacterium]